MKQILCYGDSNTWGLIPGTKNRYDWGIRWTSLLQEKYKDEDVRIIEEGLCGRTTVFEDLYRDNRNGLKTLPLVLEVNDKLDKVVIMLGTNDCKSHYKPNAYKIVKGLEQIIDQVTQAVSPENILVISPIHLGEEVWKDEFDPEFDQASVGVSKDLAKGYKELAKQKHVHFLAASDFASPSAIDQEHMDEAGHARFAQAVYDKLKSIQ